MNQWQTMISDLREKGLTQTQIAAEIEKLIREQLLTKNNSPEAAATADEQEPDFLEG